MSCAAASAFCSVMMRSWSSLSCRRCCTISSCRCRRSEMMKWLMEPSFSWASASSSFRRAFSPSSTEHLLLHAYHREETGENQCVTNIMLSSSFRRAFSLSSTEHLLLHAYHREENKGKSVCYKYNVKIRWVAKIPFKRNGIIRCIFHIKFIVTFFRQNNSRINGNLVQW